MQNPFIIHRDKVLGGRYSTALWLRQIVIYLESDGNRGSITRKNTADFAHQAAADDMIQWHKEHGVGPELIALAEEAFAMTAAEDAADKRESDLDAWFHQVGLVTRNKGKAIGWYEQFADWFVARFDEGLTPEAAAHLAIESNLN